MRTILSRSNLRLFFIAVFILASFVRCNEDETPFPHKSFYVSIALDTQLGNMLPGESKVIDDLRYGIGGLIIFRSDQNTFFAFDRACTYEASHTCVVEHLGGNTYECECCGSQFQIIQGVTDFPVMVVQGPANYPLKEYRCIFNGTNTITVSN